MIRKVLYYTDSRGFGGVEKTILQLMAGLDRSAWQPVLVHHPEPGILPLLQQAGELDARLIEIPPLPLGLSGARKLPALMRVLRVEQPSIFHAHLSWPLACKWGLVGALLERRAPVIATLHLWVDANYSLAARLQQRLIATRLGRFLTVSSDISGKLEQVFKVPQDKLQVIHSSVDSHLFDSAGSLTPPPELSPYWGRPIILAVARLDQQKGLKTLVEAAAQVPGAVFFIVGEGPERPALEMRCRELDVSDRVILTGFRQDIPAWLGHCDLFVLPSLYEGLPISLLEAMSAGKPVIASDIPGNWEAVTHAETGWLVPPAEPGALASAINLMLTNQDLAHSMAMAGKACVQRDFSTQAMNRQVAQVYSELLDETPERKNYYAQPA